MASAACIPRFSYHRLRYEEDHEFDAGVLCCKSPEVSGVSGAGVEMNKKKKKKRRRWMRRRVMIRMRMGRRLKRWLMRKKLASKAVAGSLAKVAARLKESQNHFGDLFAGNYLFLQINPTFYRH